MHLFKRKRIGTTLLEILLVLSIIMIGFIPILVFGSRTTAETVNTGSYIMAGQFAAGIMDQILAIPFEESRKKAAELAAEARQKVRNELVFRKAEEEINTKIGNNNFSDLLNKSFKDFDFSISFQESAKNPGEMFEIGVTVFWKTQQGNERSLSLNSVKFRERF